jgi:hypothetical protein
MPTGYTADLMEKGQDFRTFALTCARAFGACIMQRDDPMKEPPKKQVPSEFFAQRLDKARSDLARLKAMSPEERAAYGAAMKDTAVSERKRYIERERAENERLDAMAVQVRAWTPPSDDHKEMKRFMLQQIETSRHDLAWAEMYLLEAEVKSADDYFLEAISSAARDISSSAEEQRKEIERTEGRNRWIEQLYESLPE